MSNNIEEALQLALIELMANENVEASVYQPLTSNEENKPCNIVAKLINVKYKLPDGGSTFSRVILYIDTITFNYTWHSSYYQIKKQEIPFKSLLYLKINSMKTELGLDYIEVKEISIENNSAILFALKGTTENKADTYIIKIYLINKEALLIESNLEYKIIAETVM
jgi:hypothetical protein